MNSLKYIKLENEDGSYSSSIPLAVDGNYVDIDGHSLNDELKNLATRAEIESIASGSPAGVYDTVVALTTEDPDHNKIYVVSEDGHWYYYNNGWADGGVYQATSIFENEEMRLRTIESELYNLTFKCVDYATISRSGVITYWGTSGKVTKWINLSGYDKVSYKTYGSSNYCTVAFYDNEKHFITEGSVIGTGNYDTATINIPTGAVWVVMMCWSSITNEYITLINSNSISREMERFEEIIPSVEKDSNEVYSQLFDYSETGTFSIAKSGVRVNGTITTDDNSLRRTDYIDLKDYDKIDYTIFVNTSYYMLAFFDEDKNILHDISIVGETALVTDTIDVPINAKYVIASAWPGRTMSIHVYKENSMLEKVNIAIAGSSNLKNKKINLLGDSITSTAYTRPCWGEIISARTGATCRNYGISATTLSHTNERHNQARTDADYDPEDPSTWPGGACFVERYTEMSDDADAIVVMGGTNDNNVPLGTWNSTNWDDFYGALNTLMTGLINKYPGKPILFCTMMQTANDYTNNEPDPLSTLLNKASTDTLSMRLRAEAIKAKCRQYGLPCLDIYNTSGINGADTNKIYYRTNDRLHPSEYGQLRLANLIQNKLEELLRDYNPNNS